MHSKLVFHYIVFFIIVFSSCKKDKDENSLFQLMPASSTGINFTNSVENDKNFNIFSYRNFYNGGGVATGDINNDGLADIFFTSNMGANKLYLNKGNFKFEDISAKAGIEEKDNWNTGVVMVDINSDGWLDIYVCNAGYYKWKDKQYNKLFINNHNNTFTESAKQYGLDETGYTTHAAFFDYDLDGDLDCYILNNSFIPVNTLNYSNKRDLRAKDWSVEEFAKGGGDKLLRNDNGKFIDVSEQAHIYGSLIGFGLGVTVGDVNKDGYPDMYISNDFFERDYLYINQKDGTFSEELEKWISHTSLASMGADIADINNDGYPDIFTTDMLPGDDYRLKTTSSFDNFDVYQYKLRQGFYHQLQQNTLQINNRNGKFMETAHYSGVAGTDWSWGALVFDADNDGLQDLYVCNGIYKDVIDQDFIEFFANDVRQKMVMTGKKEEMQVIVDSMPTVPVKNKAFKNLGNLSFSDEGDKWGFTTPSFSNGAAYADLDNDGDLDLVINNVNMQSFVYKNNSDRLNQNNHISLLLKAKSPNTFAIGATVKIFSGKELITREVIPSRGFQSSTDYKLTIGLGKQKVDSMIVYWPDKTFTKIDTPAINKLHTIVQMQQKNFESYNTDLKASQLFETVNQSMEKHRENYFVDFYPERNLPVMISKEGPKAAIADVNGDLLDDIFIGGGKEQAGQLYLNNGKGFSYKTVRAFENDKAPEDVTVLFFDCDNDKDKDLIVGSGGNDELPNSPNLQLRLYVNDGKGNFSKSKAVFPDNHSNIAIIANYDLDGDGDEDLFVGGRSMSYNYGAPPESYILINDGKGNFTNATATICPSVENIGMVTDAVWANISGDERKELIIVGDWMTPRIFSWTNGKLSEIKTNLSNLYGWWKTVKATDMDGDGKEDLVLGNFGENFYLRPDEKNPVKLWINDFDKNTLPDKVFSKTIDGKDVPVFLKKEFTDAMPSLKKVNLRYHVFAKQTIQSIFDSSLINTSKTLLFNYCSSIIAYNKGEVNFEIQKMPYQAQLSSINALLCKDINGDGLTDIVIGGNTFDCMPQFGRLDADYGKVFINKGNKNFEELEPSKSGIQMDGMIKDVHLIKMKYSFQLLFLRNNDSPVLYQFKNK